jgi:hypothetical protein
MHAAQIEELGLCPRLLLVHVLLGHAILAHLQSCFPVHGE